MSGGWTNIGKIPELQRRLLFTVMILAFYRLGVHIWIPGINTVALEEIFERSEGGVFGLINTFTGSNLFARPTFKSISVIKGHATRFTLTNSHKNGYYHQ